MITIVLIYLAAWKCGVRISVICQGDNVIIIVKHKTINSEANIREVETFFSLLREQFAQAGLTLKQTETWYSRHSFEYENHEPTKVVKSAKQQNVWRD